MSESYNAFDHKSWNEVGLLNFEDFSELIEYVNQSEYGDGQLEGEWWWADDSTRTVYYGSFGNDWAPGASSYTYAEVFGEDEKDDYLLEVKRWEGFPEYLESEDDDDMDDSDDTSDDEGLEGSFFPGESDCEFLREWEDGDFSLLLWDTNTRVASGPQSRLAYQFFHKGNLIFQGADYGCSPMHAVDSDETVASLLTFFALRPGDVEREYFKDYSVQQMAFAESYGEELGVIAMEMEEKTKDLPF
jgi:hypothetical protein